MQPYVEFDRAAWRALRDATPLLLSQGDLDRLAGLGDRIDLAEVEDIYLPLSRLIDLYVGAVRGLHSSTSAFLRDGTRQTPFVIGIGGSVAVGKSTTSRLLRQLISSWPRTPSVDLITTGGKGNYMQLYLIRRGQSVNNAGWGDPNYKESPDPWLTEIGKEQAQILSEYLGKNQPITEHQGWDLHNRHGFGITHIGASLMERAAHTASYTARKLGVPFAAWEEIHESRAGVLDGMGRQS